jgi:WD40 repeat protein
MEGHHTEVWRLAVSRDGQLVASGDADREVIVWHGETGESLTQSIKAHSNRINSLDFSPNGTALASTIFLDRHNVTELSLVMFSYHVIELS